MQPHFLAALFALRAVATPQSANKEPPPEPSGIISVDGVQIDSAFITEPIFEVLSNYTDQLSSQAAPEQQQLVARQTPNDHATVTAEVASKMKAPGGGEKGVFYRGDSRPPSVIFGSGFAPQGSDTSLRNHLSFAGKSGFVSLSRSPEAAENYAFGRSGEKTQKGYIYVVAPKDVPNGYWIPGIYAPDRNPAVRRNQEFAVAGAVPAGSISHAYEVTTENPSARGKRIKNNGYSLKSSSSCSIMKRALCDPAKYADRTTSGRRTKSKVAKSFRASSRAGTAVAFTVLSPYAHDVLDLLKAWDHPIGHAVTWFDETVTSLQETIGGPQVPAIHGNTLKLRITCWIRGGQRYPNNNIDRACARLKQEDQGRPADDGQSNRLKSINNVLSACETLDQSNVALASNDVKAELLERCDEFRRQVQEQDTAAA